MNNPPSIFRYFLRIILSLAAALPAVAAPPPESKAEVDAREISRSLLHARLPAEE